MLTLGVQKFPFLELTAMTRLACCVLWLGFCLLAPGLRADNDEASSSVRGVVLGFLYPQYDDADHQRTGLTNAPFGAGEGVGVEDVLEACRGDGRLWVYGKVSGHFHCRLLAPGRGVQLLDYGGDYEPATLASRPLAMRAWPAARLPGRELAALRGEAQRQAQKLASHLRSQKNADWGVLTMILGNRAHPAWQVSVGRTTYFVAPVLRGRSEFDENIFNLIYRRDVHGLEYLGDAEGDFHGFVDVDGDGRPELLLDDHCDGTCQIYWRLAPVLKAVVRFSAGG